MEGAGRVRSRLFGISLAETRFDRRGFDASSSAAREWLETIGETFLDGYHAALADDDPHSLATRLDEVPLEWRGFAFEGAAMGLALFDLILPWRTSRWDVFVKGPAARHTFMLHVGAGWAIARIPFRVKWFLARMDPLLGCLAIDGFGFHEGYFRPRRAIEDQAVPDRVSPQVRPVFDQGLGRSLWFARGADVARIERTIARFPERRRADLWSGVGLACAYAGGADDGAVEALRRNAREYRPHVAQGVAFAAKARQLAGNIAGHTEHACNVLCGASVAAAAAITDATLADQRERHGVEAYETWRRRIRESFDEERQAR